METVKQDTLLAIKHLEYSYLKCLKIPLSASLLTDEESLETWESFASRFARVSDLVTSKYIRLRILQEEPGFRGSMIDHLNIAEKLRLIDSAETWAELRELRSAIAHEYLSNQLLALYKNILDQAPVLIAMKGRI